MEVTASTTEIDEFLNGALVSWLESCLPRPEILTGYQSLLDGTIFHVVWRQIDPEPQYHPTPLTDVDAANLPSARAKNFDCVIRNLKTLYEDELGQTLLIVPDCLVLGHSSDTRAGLEQLKLMFTLLLGAAVQCPNKEMFIGRIKELDVDTQHAIVELIRRVTDSQTLVLNSEAMQNITIEHLHDQIVRIARERDKYHSNWISSIASTAETTESKSQSNATATSTSTATVSDQNHAVVELADLRSKLRKVRQELEEKSESYIEVKEELEHKNSQYEKLRVESQEWYTESRRAAAYRDEVDVLRERADRADRLEVEVQRFREKLSDADFFKTRVEELREDNRMLTETKEMLEEQLTRSRKRSEQSMMLESEIIKYKQKLNDMALERDADKSKLQELLDENTQLQLATKAFNKLSIADRVPDDNQSGENPSGDNSLSEQLTNNAQTRAIKLELENRRLQQALDAMRESSFHETTNKLLELEKEKKMLTLKVDQMQESCNRFTQQNQELEEMFKNALEENKKLQDSIDNRQQANERQLQDREVDRMKLIDLEKQVESVTKEKHRIQTLSESIQRRADDLERFLDSKTKELDLMQPKAKACDRLQMELTNVKEKLNALEKENANLAKDVSKFKESLEVKEVNLDENSAQLLLQSHEIETLRKQLTSATAECAKIQELESKNNEYASQGKIHNETISTLQTDLIAKTVALKKLEKELEKLGIDCSSDELNVETVIEKLLKNADHMKICRDILLSMGRDAAAAAAAASSGDDSVMSSCILCQKNNSFVSPDREADLVHHTEEVLSSVSAQWKEQCDQLAAANADLQAASETLQSENARLKVDVSTLSSQITSLNTQHVALQLANSQLASEKDSIGKTLESVKKKHEALLNDQLQFQSLHEQLGTEYETLNGEKEMLKATLRDQRNENRDLREHEESRKNQTNELLATIETMKRENESFVNLRGEHSKLKDDFRTLYTTSERLKSEYKNIQEQYKKLRSENARLNLHNTENTGELSVRIEQAKSLEIELTTMSHRCELLQQVNANLEGDRRALMEHVTQLLGQYRELLAHSLDDKQHYHDEEKIFTDKVHNLHRQKETLEKKIMEFYRNFDNCPQKKKAFGSALYKRVKKASTDLMSKVPTRSNRRSWNEESRLTQSQTTLGGFESGGNESDNSADESHSIASDTNLIKKSSSATPPPPPPPHQRKEAASVEPVNRSIAPNRNNYQPLRREDSVRSHRNNMHGLEPPDVTGSSLTLGAAGSRRTVYLVDENSKLPDPNSGSSPTASATTSNDTQESAKNNNNATTTSISTPTTTTGSNDQTPSTFLMYNRVSNIIGDPAMIGSASASMPLSQETALGGSNSPSNGTNDKKKPDAVWYEYGCV